MATTRPIRTAEDLWAAGDLGPCELVRGEVRMMNPPGGDHGRIANNIAFLLTSRVKAAALGTVYVETGFVLARDPDSVRAPDVAFIRAERRAETATPGYIPGAPDLAVEVVSPNDTAREVAAKVDDWLRAGCREVWVADPRAHTVTVHQAGHGARTLGAGDRLSGGIVLPGLDVSVAAIFA